MRNFMEYFYRLGGFPEHSLSGNFQQSVFYLPAFHINHYFLIRVNISDMTMTYYDSFFGIANNEEHLLQLKNAFSEVAAIPIDGWNPDVRVAVPQQTNGFECGYFVIKFLDYLLRGQDVGSVDGREVAALRLEIAEVLFEHASNEGRELLDFCGSIEDSLRAAAGFSTVIAPKRRRQ